MITFQTRVGNLTVTALTAVYGTDYIVGSAADVLCTFIIILCSISPYYY